MIRPCGPVADHPIVCVLTGNIGFLADIPYRPTSAQSAAAAATGASERSEDVTVRYRAPGGGDLHRNHHRTRRSPLMLAVPKMRQF
jgi:hypothetical protein